MMDEASLDNEVAKEEKVADDFSSQADQAFAAQAADPNSTNEAQSMEGGRLPVFFLSLARLLAGFRQGK